MYVLSLSIYIRTLWTAIYSPCKQTDIQGGRDNVFDVGEGEFHKTLHSGGCECNRSIVILVADILLILILK